MRGALHAHFKQVSVGIEVICRVEHQHLADAVVLHVSRQRGVVVPQVEPVHLPELLRQEGGQGVGVGVPDHQQLWALSVRVLDHAQRLVAAQEVGVFVLDLQLFGARLCQLTATA